MILRTFKKGGIHPADMKALSKDRVIESGYGCSELLIPLSQHIGAPAVMIRKTGDHLNRGEIIAEAGSFISANIHAPLSGTVTGMKKVLLPNGISSDAVVFKADEVQTQLFENRYDWDSKSPEELLNEIKEAGIVGQGGATFPTNVKLSVPEGTKVEYLIINGIECEPYLTSDYRIMLEKTDEIIRGIRICSRILKPEKTYICFEKNKTDAYELFTKKLAGLNTGIETALFKMKYPQGDEKQLINALTGRQIPSGKLPINVGCVLLNIGTVWSVCKAVERKMPLIERVVTVSGDCVEKPSNYLVPIGTPFSYLIEKSGGLKKEPKKIISGGPMMGFSISGLDVPVCKGSGGIVLLGDKPQARETNCIHCGRCISVCPMGLQPTQMYKLISNGEYEQAFRIGLSDCKECGCCSYSCPAHLKLVHTFKLGKKMRKQK